MKDDVYSINNRTYSALTAVTAQGNWKLQPFFLFAFAGLRTYIYHCSLCDQEPCVDSFFAYLVRWFSTLSMKGHTFDSIVFNMDRKCTGVRYTNLSCNILLEYTSGWETNNPRMIKTFHELKHLYGKPTVYLLKHYLTELKVELGKLTAKEKSKLELLHVALRLISLLPYDYSMGFKCYGKQFLLTIERMDTPIGEVDSFGDVISSKTFVELSSVEIIIRIRENRNRLLMNILGDYNE